MAVFCNPGFSVENSHHVYLYVYAYKLRSELRPLACYIW